MSAKPRFGRFLRYLPFYALYFFHCQKERFETRIGGRNDEEQWIEWYKGMAKKAGRIFFVALVPFAAIAVVTVNVWALIAFLVAMSALHNYSELAMGIALERKLEEMV